MLHALDILINGLAATVGGNNQVATQPGMDQLPFTDHGPQHALGGLGVEIDLPAQNLDGRTDFGTLAIDGLSRSDLSLPAVDVVDDGQMLGAVHFQRLKCLELLRRQMDPHHETHRGGYYAADISLMLFVCPQKWLTLLLCLSCGNPDTGLVLGTSSDFGPFGIA